MYSVNVCAHDTTVWHWLLRDILPVYNLTSQLILTPDEIAALEVQGLMWDVSNVLSIRGLMLKSQNWTWKDRKHWQIWTFICLSWWAAKPQIWIRSCVVTCLFTTRFCWHVGTQRRLKNRRFNPWVLQPACCTTVLVQKTVMCIHKNCMNGSFLTLHGSLCEWMGEWMLGECDVSWWRYLSGRKTRKVL